MDGVLYQLKNGCRWQDLPKDLPPYSTLYWHYKRAFVMEEDVLPNPEDVGFFCSIGVLLQP